MTQPGPAALVLASGSVDGIDGDPGTVIGLSLPLLRRMLATIGVTITDLWRAPGGRGPAGHGRPG